MKTELLSLAFLCGVLIGIAPAEQPIAPAADVEAALKAGKYIQRSTVTLVDGVGTVVWPSGFTNSYQIAVSKSYGAAVVTTQSTVSCTIKIPALNGTTKRINVVGIEK
ncbi:MAG: hypothetical protein QM813_26355 [Verrucomicrobiota bacterium]